MSIPLTIFVGALLRFLGQDHVGWHLNISPSAIEQSMGTEGSFMVFGLYTPCDYDDLYFHFS